MLMCLAEQVSRPGESLSLPYVARLSACLSNDDRVPDTGTGWPGSPTSISEVLHSQSLLGSPACNACQGLSCPIRPQSLGPLLQLVARQTRAAFRPSLESSPVQSSLASQTCKCRHNTMRVYLPSFQTSSLDYMYLKHQTYDPAPGTSAAASTHLSSSIANPQAHGACLNSNPT